MWLQTMPTRIVHSDLSASTIVTRAVVSIVSPPRSQTRRRAGRHLLRMPFHHWGMYLPAMWIVFLMGPHGSTWAHMGPFQNERANQVSLTHCHFDNIWDGAFNNSRSLGGRGRFWDWVRCFSGHNGGDVIRIGTPIPKLGDADTYWSSFSPSAFPERASEPS